MAKLRVVIVKPSKYGIDGYVERFRRGFMPNTTLYHLASMTPAHLGDVDIEVQAVDEYVQTDLAYLDWLQGDADSATLLALVGVQSHQYHRSLDLAALALERGVGNAILGGPHPITCDTSELEGSGVSICRGEAELCWSDILADAAAGPLRPVYGTETRWQTELDPPVVAPPDELQLRSYAAQMFGVYPARGCPYRCTFCSVIKLAGQTMRSQPIETTMATLRGAKQAGVLMIHFSTDNFNKYDEAHELLQAMIDEQLDLPFFVQCDAQVVHQPELVELLARAGCYQIFLGVESLSRKSLLAVQKNQNHPRDYREILRMCSDAGIGAHFSNIIGFPDDTEESILEQLAAVRDLGPEVASFYILTPFPGTDMYDDYRARDVLIEPNLDRYDATYPTWRHPHLTQSQLLDLLHRCHRQFYAAPDVLQKSARWAWKKRHSDNILLKIATPAFSVIARNAASHRQHPLSGGFGQTRLDHQRDYRALRRELYGFDLSPLPESLAAPQTSRQQSGQSNENTRPGKPVPEARVESLLAARV